ncbi:MAG: alpha/beta hydrolase, partial [Myxococcaceae bacterium]
KKLNLRPPVVVFGNSMGGFAAALLALKPDTPIDSLVLSSPAGAPMTEAEFDRLKKLFALRNDKQADAFVKRIFAHPPSWPMSSVYDAAVRNQFDHPILQKLINSVHSSDLLTNEKLAQLKANTTVYWGQQDKVLPKAEEHFWETTGNSCISVTEVPEAGHMPFFEDVQMVTRWITKACKPLTPSVKLGFQIGCQNHGDRERTS